MSYVADLISKIDDLQRRLTSQERLEFPPSPSSIVTYTGTPTAGRYAYWTGAGTIADSALANYDEGTWSPTVYDASSGGNAASGTFVGRYTRIGNLVTLFCNLNNITTSGMTAGNTLYVRDLPFAARTLTNWRAIGVVRVSRLTFSGWVIANIESSEQVLTFYDFTSGNNIETAITVGDIASSGFSDIHFTIAYQV